ncbi:MAG: hypothetical protein ABIM13_05110 [candidate division WOR-3 bacterium]
MKKISIILSIIILYSCKGIKPVPMLSNVEERIIDNGSKIILKWERLKDVDGYNVYFDENTEPDIILSPHIDSLFLPYPKKKVEITVFREDIESRPYVLDYKVKVDTFIFYPNRLADPTKPSGFYFDSLGSIKRVNTRDTFIKKCDFVFEEIIENDTSLYLYGPRGWYVPWNQKNNKISMNFSDLSIGKCDTAFLNEYKDVVKITLGKTYFLWFTEDTVLNEDDNFAKIYITLKDDEKREYYVQIGYQKKKGIRWLKSE